MHVNGRAMVLASFAADAHALGAHWIYDTERIEKEFGRVESLRKPSPNSFHANKAAGDFTHYGDQAFVLLESLARRGGFHLDDFWRRWQDLFRSYDGYFDQATKATLRNARDGRGPEEAGSFSDELAGASRIAPLVFCYAHDRKTLEEAIRAQTRMTHNNPIVLQCGLFFAHTVLSIFEGASPIAAIETHTQPFEDTPLGPWIRAGLDSRETESLEAIRRFGQTCHTEQAFPSVIHLISRYEQNLKEGLIQSVMAGGDSAGRNLIVGMVLGAHLGMDAIPDDWIAGMAKGAAIQQHLNQLAHRPSIHD